MRNISHFHLLRWGVLVAASVCTLSASQEGGRRATSAVLEWDETTLRLIQPDGVYGRMVRLSDHSILCSFEWRGSIYVRQSADEGTTWSNPVKVVEFRFGAAANPEMLVLHDGSVLLSYNERPTDGVHPFTIRVCFSRDNGRTWTDNALVYEGGTSFDTGCWEPAQVQRSWGEIDLFFANEKPYTKSSEQEITLLRSYDGGGSWSAPERASFRPGHRDGMPVPLILAGRDEVIVAIEDDGLLGTFKPAVAAPGGADSGQLAFVDAPSARWPALKSALPGPVYAGAPYVRQFPSGETVLSIQSGQDRAKPWTMEFSRMVVYVGDTDGKNFANPTEPFDIAPDANGLWNSLFIKNADTITAISATTINGVRGLWSIDARLRHVPTSNQAGPSGASVTRQRAHAAGRPR